MHLDFRLPLRFHFLDHIGNKFQFLKIVLKQTINKDATKYLPVDNFGNKMCHIEYPFTVQTFSASACKCSTVF